MHTEKREDPLVELGYEVRDLNTVAIRNATIGFFIFAFASAAIGFGCYRIMNPKAFEPSDISHRVVPKAPYPLVQSTTGSKTDIMDIRQHETSMLTGPVTWVDPAKSHLRIPIERAMEIIGSRGAQPTGASVPAISKGHTPDPAIGEKSPITISPDAVRGGAISSKPGKPEITIVRDGTTVINNPSNSTINIDMDKGTITKKPTEKPAPKKTN